MKWTDMPIQELNIEAQTSEEFWSLIDNGGQFRKSEKLLYRGQADANWPLIPSIFRHHKDIQLSTEKLVFPNPKSDEIFKEWVSLQNFIQHCNTIGLSLPFDTDKFKNEYLGGDYLFKCFERNDLWPHPNVYQLMALAQHYKLPTRLLDWSKSAFVATYFAASDSLNILIKDGDFRKKMAVWILNVDDIELFSELEIVEVPSELNNNLTAQEGCFTLLRCNPSSQTTNVLDEYFRNLTKCPLIKITLPVMLAPVILRLCSEQNITGATVFPDFYGASQAALDTFNISQTHAYLKELLNEEKYAKSS